MAFSDSSPFSVSIQAPGIAPAWFVSQADGTWTTVASVGVLNNVLDTPTAAQSFGCHANAIFDSYTGFVVDQNYKEYIAAACGGHGDGADNAVYSLTLQTAVPAWRRLVDRTPDANMPMSNISNSNGGVFADGRPRASHNANSCWADGKYWMPVLSAATSGAGNGADIVVSMDRAALGAASSPLAYNSGNLGPWKIWGSSGQNINNFSFGGCVFDSVNHKLVAVANASAAAGGFWQFVNTTGGSIGVSTAFNTAVMVYPGWLACAPELGIVIAADAGFNGNICVLDINPASPTYNTWTVITNIIGTGYWPAVGAAFRASIAGCMWGAMYVAANKTIAVGDPFNIGGQIYKLKIPTTGGGAYAPAGQWVWTNATPTGGPTLADFHGAGGSNFCASKWNLVQDMGNGQSALVYCPHLLAPTFIYKIPLAGI